MQVDADYTATVRRACLAWLWHRVIEQVAAMRLPDGSRYQVCTDDVMMRDADATNCMAWLDDCAARLGCDVAAARTDMGAYLAVRDGRPGDPAVRDAAVTGVPDARFGERIAALVEASGSVSEAELIEHVCAQLAH